MEMKITAASTAAALMRIFQCVFICLCNSPRLRVDSGYTFKKKFRCFSLIGIPSFSITFMMSSQTLRFSLIA